MQRSRKQTSTRKKAPGRQTVSEASTAFFEELGHRIRPVTARNYRVQHANLATFFKGPLRSITNRAIEKYQAARLNVGQACTSTVNMELARLAQLLRRTDLWHRLDRRYQPLKRKEPQPGRALLPDEVDRLIAVASKGTRRRPAADALLLALSTGMRTVEILNLRWSDVSLASGTIVIQRTKTAAGFRTIFLNATARKVLEDRLNRAIPRGFAEAEHFVFPFRSVDPTRPQLRIASAWRAIRKEAGVTARFHDTRHTAITALAEAGIPEAVARAQVGHASQLALRIYQHPRALALREASAALERKQPTGANTDADRPNRNRIENGKWQRRVLRERKNA